MKKPRHHVTDHAVLQYLKRVNGVDIEAVRCEIGRKIDKAAEMGACGVVVDGARFVIENGVVVTVTIKNRPDISKGRKPVQKVVQSD